MNPVVESISIVILDGSQAVSDIFKGVNNGACEVIGRVSLIFSTSSVVRLTLNSIENRIAQTLHRAVHI